MDRFQNRRDAGALLGRELTKSERRTADVVLALPRGGVPVAFEVARACGAPLDIFVVRKIGLPGHEELAMGAVASGGVRFLNEDVVGAYGIPETVIDAAAGRELRRIHQLETIYRAAAPGVEL